MNQELRNSGKEGERPALRLKREINEVLRAVADPKHLACDEEGFFCPYCAGPAYRMDLLADPSRYDHAESCPVMKARRALAEVG